MRNKTALKTYLLYMLATISLVVLIATVQYTVNADIVEFQAKLYIAPILVGALVGFLLANQRLLRNQIEIQGKRFASIVEMAEEFSFIEDKNSNYSYVSPSCLKVTGYKEEAFYQCADYFRELVNKKDLSIYDGYRQQVEAGRAVPPIKIRICQKKGDSIWLRYERRALFEDQALVGFCCTSMNISDEVAQRRALRDLSEHDPLTGLANRRKLDSHIDSLMKQSLPFNLVMMDLNRFKFINDSLGHTYGDRLLTELSSRVMDIMPQNAMLARFGGDEFVIVVRQDIDISVLINEILQTVEKPIDLDDYHLKISASFGWVSYPQDAADKESLIRFADATMYNAKEKPGVSVLSYEQTKQQDHGRVLQIEYKMQSAIEQGQIQAYYQPIVNNQGKVAGAEVLARWYDVELGWITPDEFIPIAESTNMISQLGMQMMEQAVICAKHLSNSYPDTLYISVNVSPQQMIETAFFSRVKQLLQKHDLPPSLLKIEVTETLFIGGDQQTIDTLSALRRLGVQIALDDFGTGYSALGVLRDECIDLLKIDRSFVSDMLTNEVDKSLVAKIIEMAHQLKLKVIAEGVESEHHSGILKALQCDMQQGYFFSKPLSEKDFERWLQEHN